MGPYEVADVPPRSPRGPMAASVPQARHRDAHVAAAADASAPREPSPPGSTFPYPLCGSAFLRHLRAHGKTTFASYPQPGTPSTCLTPSSPLSPSFTSKRGLDAGAAAASSEGRQWAGPPSPYPLLDSPFEVSSESSGTSSSGLSGRDPDGYDQPPSSHPFSTLPFPASSAFKRRRSSESSTSARVAFQRDGPPARRPSTPTMLRRPLLPSEPRDHGKLGSSYSGGDDARFRSCTPPPLPPRAQPTATASARWRAERGVSYCGAPEPTTCDRVDGGAGPAPSPRLTPERHHSGIAASTHSAGSAAAGCPDDERRVWHEFAVAYSHGAFDPLHTPLFPEAPHSVSHLPRMELPQRRPSVADSERHPALRRPSSVPRSETRSKSDRGTTRTKAVGAGAGTVHPSDNDRDGDSSKHTPQRAGSAGYGNVTHPDEMRQFYRTYGFLPAPLPPNEAERLNALYSYNILHTGEDLNFDRIVHMTKLVFGAPMAFLSLLDGESQAYKSYLGLGHEVSEHRRSLGFCAHVVLANSDEPLVVLDATKDWRFRNNPFVTGHPPARFYAGAPLRTADGHNLGALAVVDTKPRAEFSPRSRLILKEFAAIVMRELDLWRDRRQLRVRDRVQKATEDFTRECLEINDDMLPCATDFDAHLSHVYRRAAELIMSTLDLDGCTILDISEMERVETPGPDGTPCTAYRALPFSGCAVPASSGSWKEDDNKRAVISFPVLSSTSARQAAAGSHPLDTGDHEAVASFLRDHRQGRIYSVRPTWLRSVLPRSSRYAMVVPIMGIDQQPFALICAHTHDKGKQFLEGFELQFLRSIGAIILSAVLRRRTVLADRSKNVLISSVSHELRTPLHGMLGAGELLSDTPLDTDQESFLAILRTCGLQLIETVNHVLDFAKLSIEGKDRPACQMQFRRVDLGELIHSTLEGCWLGQRARQMQIMDRDNDIGSFYAPEPKSLLPAEQRLYIHEHLSNVETVLDIGYRRQGWNVVCETGGIRRIIMNLYNNSLKFTGEGYVQVVLRELPHPPGQKRIPVELRVIDTGKGIGKTFLKNQLFEPFAQENPLQPGTGLGLAIVGSIVTSEAIGGTLNVYSAEDVGTEVRIKFEVETVDDDEAAPGPAGDPLFGTGFKLAFVNYSPSHRGLHLQAEVMANYARCLGFGVTDEVSDADIVVVNEAAGVTPEIRDTCRGRPMLLVISFKIQDMCTLNKLGRMNAYTGILYKPMGITPFVRALEAAVQWTHDPANPDLLGAVAQLRRAAERREHVKPLLRRSDSSLAAAPDKDACKLLLAHRPRTPLTDMSPTSTSPTSSTSRHQSRPSLVLDTPLLPDSPIARVVPCPPETPGARAPNQGGHAHTPPAGPGHQSGIPLRPLPSRTLSAPLPPGFRGPGGRGPNAPPVWTPMTPLSALPSPGVPRPMSSAASSIGSNATGISTVSIADGGVILASCEQPQPSAPTLRQIRPPRIMVVEDNPINRRVLSVLLKKRNFEYTEAINGALGVELFQNSPPNHWDAILMDITMPVMDGLEATRVIRGIEATRRAQNIRGATPSAAPPASVSGPPRPTLHRVMPPSAVAPAPQNPPAPPPPPVSLPPADSALALGPAFEPDSPTELIFAAPAPPLDHHTKIFALTGLATVDDKKKAFASGVDGYLVKPVSLGTLDLLFKKIGF